MEEKHHLYFRLDALSIALYSPISFLSFLLASTGSELGFMEIIALGLVLTLVITGILFLILWIQKFIEDYRSIRRIEFVLPLIFVGLLRALFITIILAPDFSSFAENLYARIPVSVFSTLLWLGLLTYIIQHSKIYNEKYQALFTQAVLESVNQNPQIESVSLKNIPEIIRLKNKLDILLNFENIDSNEVDSITQAAETIRDHIASELRPLSHRLWDSADFHVPKVRIWNLAKDAVRDLNFSVLHVFLPWCGLFLLGTLPFYSPQNALELTLAFSFVIGLPLVAAKIMIVRRTNAVIVLISLFLAYLIFTVAFTEFFIAVFSLNLRLKNSLLINSLTAITSVVFVVFNSCILLFNSDRRKVLQSVEEALALMRDRKFTASYLHNSVQSELTAISMQLSATREGPLSPQVRGAIERLDSLVNREFSLRLQNGPLQFGKELQELCELWHGVASLDFSGISIAKVSNLEASLLLFFIEEFVANSVRHGKANQISVSMEVDQDHLALVARHNGREPIREGTGLGFAWLNEVAQDGWSISINDGNTTVVAHIPRLI